jgi:DNA-binding response OmpR family regulator
MTDEATTEPLKGSVLYIEDVDVNYLLVESILAPHAGVKLSRASTGIEGVRRVRNEFPDFVLLDMHLPDISGLEVVRLLSETIAERQLRVTILTGDHLTMDVIKAMSLGAYEYMLKPVDPALLEAGVRRALTGKQASPSNTLASHR